MAFMPLPTAGQDDLSFNGGLAAPAPRREKFVEVQMAVETQGRVSIIQGRQTVDIVRSIQVCGPDFDAGQAAFTMCGRFWIESYAFEKLAALATGEAVGMEAL